MQTKHHQSQGKKKQDTNTIMLHNNIISKSPSKIQVLTIQFVTERFLSGQNIGNVQKETLACNQLSNLLPNRMQYNLDYSLKCL